MWSPRLAPGFAPDGTPILSVLAKRTYVFGPGGMAKPDDANAIPFFEADQFYGKGNPETDAPKQEMELVEWKPLVDVVLHGLAHAPTGRLGQHFDVVVDVGGVRGAVRVFGNRKVDFSRGSVRFTDPEPFPSMPIHWGLAYGGVDRWTHPEVPMAFPPNPIGKGFAVDPPPHVLHGMELPNLENTQKFLTPETFLVKKFDRWTSCPQPAALGWTPRRGYPRIAMGTSPPMKGAEADKARARISQNMPLALLDVPAPLPTQARNHLQNNGAPPFLRLRSLQGSEPVVMGYMDPEHPRFEFSLPDDPPRGFLDLGEGMVELPMSLATVEIFKPTNQVTLLWRGSARYPGADWLAQNTQLNFTVESA